MAVLGVFFLRPALEIARLTTVFDADTRRVEVAFDTVERKARGFDSSLGSLTRSSLGLATGLAGLTAALTAGGGMVLRYTANLEQARIGFTTLLRSSQAADQHLRELQSFAARTPFEFPDLLVASRRFINMGKSVEDIIPFMTDVGNAVSAIGGGQVEIDRVSKALSDMAARGKVSAEELNQLSDVGISGMRILEDATGKSRAEITKLSEQGKISSDVFIQAFRRFSQVNFAGAMEAQSRTFLGAMSTIKDSLLQTSSTAFKPLFDRISEIAVRLSQEVQKSVNFGQALAEVLKSAGATVGAAGGELARSLIDAIVAEIRSERSKSEFMAGVNDLFRIGAAAYEAFEDALRGKVTPKPPPRASVVNERDPLSGFLVPRTMTPEEVAGGPAPPLLALPSTSFGGGGRGGRGISTAQQEAQRLKGVLEGLIGIQERVSLEMAFFGDTSRKAAIEQDYLRGGIEKLTGSLRARAEESRRVAVIDAEAIDRREKEVVADQKIRDLYEDITTTLSGQLTMLDLVNRAIKDAEAFRAIDAQEKAWLRAGAVLSDYRKNVDALVESATRLPAIGPALELPPGFGHIDVGGEPPDETLRRRGLEARQIWEDTMEEMGRSTEDILVNSFSRVYEDGFLRSTGNMLLSFTEMLNEMALRALAANIAGKIFDTQGGGGWLGKIFGWFAGAVAGGMGGGGGASTSGGGAWGAAKGFRQWGGPVFAGTPYMVHQDELFVPTTNGQIFNREQMGGNTFVFNIPAPRGAGNATQKREAREYAEMIAGLIAQKIK